MLNWLKENSATAVGWVAVVVLVGWNGGARLAMIEGTQAEAEREIAETSEVVEKHESEIVSIKGDVRSLSEGARRQEVVLTRQEDNLRELDRLVVELKTITKRDP